MRGRRRGKRGEAPTRNWGPQGVAGSCEDQGADMMGAGESVLGCRAPPIQTQAVGPAGTRETPQVAPR